MTQNTTSIPYDSITAYCELNYGQDDGSGYAVQSVNPAAAAYVVIVHRWYVSFVSKVLVQETRIIAFRSEETEQGQDWYAAANIIV